MIEKRQFLRLRAPIGITYRDVDTLRKRDAVLSYVKNIGGGGVSLIVKEDLKAGDILELEIQIPHQAEPVKVMSEVVWFSVAKSGEHQTREAGAKFRSLPPAEMNRILEYVHAIGVV